MRQNGDSSHPTVGVARSQITTVVLLRASRWALNSYELDPATVETFWLRTFAPRLSRVGKQILYGCSSWQCVKNSSLVFFLVCFSFLRRIFTIYLGFSATLTLTDARKKHKLKDQSWFFFLLPWKASVSSFFPNSRNRVEKQFPGGEIIIFSKRFPNLLKGLL